MMHSSPMPLTIALDLAKRLQHELAGHLTVEQKRDLTRVQRLINEAQKSHISELSHLRQQHAAAAVAPKRRGFRR